MTSILELMNEAAELEDQTATPEFTEYEYKIPDAGVTVGRLIEYIELGKQPQRPHMGKPKPPHEEVRIVFELTHPKNVKEIEVEGGTKKIADQMAIKLTKKLGDKAAYKKLFTKMARGRPDIKHMAQMLGEPFILTVHHNESGEGDKKKTYANLRASGEGAEWGVAGPFQDDPLAGTRQDISAAIPAALSPLKLFLWNKPTKETWDSLYIDGTREVKDDKGNTVQKSKNWLQELILSATDYAGSQLEAMLHGVDNLSIKEEPKNETKTETKADASGIEIGSSVGLPGDDAASSATAAQGEAKASATVNPAAAQSAAAAGLAALGLTV